MGSQLGRRARAPWDFVSWGPAGPFTHAGRFFTPSPHPLARAEWGLRPWGMITAPGYSRRDFVSFGCFGAAGLPREALDPAQGTGVESRGRAREGSPGRPEAGRGRGNPTARGSKPQEREIRVRSGGKSRCSAAGGFSDSDRATVCFSVSMGAKFAFWGLETRCRRVPPPPPGLGVTQGPRGGFSSALPPSPQRRVVPGLGAAAGAAQPQTYKRDKIPPGIAGRCDHRPGS